MKWKNMFFFKNLFTKKEKTLFKQSTITPRDSSSGKNINWKKCYNLISLFTQLSTNSVSLLVKSPDNQTPYKLKETNTPSSSGLLHAGFSPPLLLTEQGGGTSVLRRRTAEGGRAGEICSPTLSIFFQSTPTSEAYFEPNFPNYVSCETTLH